MKLLTGRRQSRLQPRTGYAGYHPRRRQLPQDHQRRLTPASRLHENRGRSRTPSNPARLTPASPSPGCGERARTCSDSRAGIELQGQTGQIEPTLLSVLEEPRKIVCSYFKPAQYQSNLVQKDVPGDQNGFEIQIGGQRFKYVFEAFLAGRKRGSSFPLSS